MLTGTSTSLNLYRPRTRRRPRPRFVLDATEAIDYSSQFPLYNPGHSSIALTHAAARFLRTRTITIKDSCAG